MLPNLTFWQGCERISGRNAAMGGWVRVQIVVLSARAGCVLFEELERVVFSESGTGVLCDEQVLLMSHY